ncbi:hypothetical protein HOC32_04855, partial [Candidatus Woesearchaeota archaeon]|nr:hypothetical protein [Candidatus Woesearchaeota archaeon]
MREKRGLLVVLLVLVLALSAVQVVAEEGCYLYLDGDESLYCNSVTREEATADCELYGDCDIGTIFIPGECDLEIFPQCEEVKCSVDCSFHKLGVCEELGRTLGEDESLAGVAVTTETDSFWCDDRCASAGSYCSNGPVKRWESLEGAFNRGLPEGSIDENFDALSVSACIDWCGTDIGTGSLTGLVLADG